MSPRVPTISLARAHTLLRARNVKTVTGPENRSSVERP